MNYTSFDSIKFDSTIKIDNEKVLNASHDSGNSGKSDGLLSSFIKKVKTALQVPATTIATASPDPSSSNDLKISITSPKGTTSSVNKGVQDLKVKEEKTKIERGSKRTQSMILGFVGYSVSSSNITRPSSAQEETVKKSSSAFTSKVPSRLGKKARTPENLLIFNDTFDKDFVKSLTTATQDMSVSDRNTLDSSQTLSLNTIHHRRNSSSSFSSASNTPVSSRQGIFGKFRFGSSDVRKDYWMRDEISKECYQCKLPFTTFRRRHHCRVCGQVFCGKCASETVSGEKIGLDSDVRVCDYCFKMIMEYNLPEAFEYTAEPFSPATNIDYVENEIPAHLKQLSTTLDIPTSANQSFKVSTIKQQSSIGSQNANSFDSLRRLFSGSQNLIRFFNNPQSNPHFTVSSISSVDHYGTKSTANLPFRTYTENEGFDEDEDEREISPKKERDVFDHESSKNLKNVPPDSLVYFLSSQNRPSHRKRRKTEDKKHSMFLSVDIPKPFVKGAKSLGVPGMFLSPSSVPDPDSPRMNPEAVNYLRMSSDDILSELPSQEIFKTLPKKIDEVPLLQLNSKALEFIRRYSNQLFSLFEIPHAKEWEEEIIKLVMKICFNVKPNVRQGDDIDIRKLVKLKKVQGSKITNTEFVQGVVFTKNVIHKQMLSKKIVSNPKILLLGFALQYDRSSERHFSSLEPLLQQEKEYLKSIVQRISELQPDVILCQQQVSRTALEFLLEHDIVCFSNVKLSVLELISKSTGAEICKSLDRITLTYSSLKLGSCGKFYIKMFYKSENNKGIRNIKSLVFFDECSTNKGCSILLRGSDNVNTFKKIKKAVDLMILLSYNLILESSFLKDEQRIVTYDFESGYSKSLDERGLWFSNFLLPYQRVVLSVSPGINFLEPYLLRRMVLKEIEVHGLANQEHELLENVYESFKTFLNSAASFSELPKFNFPSNFPEDIKLGLSYILSHINQQITPYKHQNILILYCSINIRTQLPCFPPDFHLIEYYNKASDMTLGQFIEELCYDSSFECPASCSEKKTLLLHHYRSYIHSDFRLNVKINEVKTEFTLEKGVIYNYLFCKKCRGVVTPLIPISDNSWNYSFGKFLELKFYGKHQFLDLFKERCSHSRQSDIVENFMFNNLTVTFSLEKITLFEVIRPPLKILYKDLFELKEADCGRVREQINNFFASVTRRILSLQLLFKKFIPASRDSNVLLDNHKSMVNVDNFLLLSKLLNTFIDIKDDDLLSINQIRLQLYLNGVKWDRIFSELVKKFILILQDYMTNHNNPESSKSDEVLRLAPSIPTPSVLRSPDILSSNLFSPDNVSDSPTKIIRESVRFSRILTDIENDLMTFTLENMKEDSVLNVKFPKNLSVTQEDDVKGSEKILDAINTDKMPSLKQVKDLLIQALQQEIIPPNLVRANMLSNSLTSTAQVLAPVMSSWLSASGQPVLSLNNDVDSFQLLECFDFKPLDYGILNSDHYLLDSNIIIRETEPTSIIAYTLDSKHYRDEIVKIREVTTSSSNNSSELEGSLLSKAGSHVKYEFQAGNLKCFCRAYFAEQFDAIRKLADCDDSFIQSLSRCADFKTKGGQSGSQFFKTKDDRYILKQLSKPEMEAFIGFATAYFSHMHQVFFNDLPSVLVKLLGVYRIGFRNSQDFLPGASLSTVETSMNGSASNIGIGSIKIDLVVMENLFYKRHMRRIFDLKGSMRNRHVQATGSHDEVLLDENLIEIMGHNPLFIREHSKRLVRASVWNDTLFLSRQNVMDYSLLVGIDDETLELVVGIVDFIRTFTWDKKLESWVKESGILGGGGKEPTIVSPKLYKNRFREAMERYFLMVPDKFCDIDTVLSVYSPKEHE